jgi:diadenosine tetraphosphate (Ap4A) HIT family hydrolase
MVHGEPSCPFCSVGTDQLVAESTTAIALFDGCPVAEGHTLVTPRRHVASLFELSDEEQADVWHLVTQTRHLLQKRFKPTGFNIGVNDGKAAGQTVPHAHFHLIPRYAGDVEDPRGGIRWVLPDKAPYWKRTT